MFLKRAIFCVVRRKPDILKEHIATTFGIEEYTKQENTKCKRQVERNTRALPKLHGVTTQKFALFIVTTVMPLRGSNMF
jgi:hypothetical protein